MLLSDKDPDAAKALDAIFGGALLAAAPFGAGALSLFDPKNNILRYSRDLVGKLSVRLRGLSVPDRSKNVRAAWTVLAMAAFCDSVASHQPFHELRTEMEIQLLQQNHGRGLLRAILDAEVPFPATHESIVDLEKQLTEFFLAQAGPLFRFLRGFRQWDELSDSSKAGLGIMCVQATERFNLLFRRLAAEVPELLVWITLRESYANRVQVIEAVGREIRSSHVEMVSRMAEVETGLAGMRLLLEAVSSHDQAPTGRWQRSLAGQYAFELTKPLVDIGGEGAAPSVVDGYLNPNFRLAISDAHCHPAVESWWDGQQLRNDLQEFLTTFLLTEDAMMNPLLVLGHPGAGKSVLTRVLAGQLPSALFSVVRVVLRDVAASSRLIGQIEAALHQTIHEHVQWPEFVERLHGVVPVILLDGFDELIQATGTSRSDYLEQVQEFQESERAQGRPVAVLITTRTTVADRARIPEGTTVIKLEPFDDHQVRTWIAKWNELNPDAVEPDAVMTHRELAIQPVLLLMLVLYETATKGLRHGGETLNRVALYEKLLTTFVEREVTKAGRLDPPVLAARVEEQLYLLSVVAFAMFNRGRQTIHEHDLETDFRGLLLGQSWPEAAVVEGFQTRLSAAQLTLGRFFFVHPSLAREVAGGAAIGQSFEFLHSTFGEFLVARCAISVLKSIAQRERPATPWQPAEPPRQDPLLRALLSFQALTKRRQVVNFLTEMARQLPIVERESLARTTGHLLTQCMKAEDDTRYNGYQPVQVEQPHRYAHYSFNLYLVYLACQTQPVSVGQYLTWRRWTGLWISQMDTDAWGEACTLVDIAMRDGAYVVSIGLTPSDGEHKAAFDVTDVALDTSNDVDLRSRRLLLDSMGGSAIATLRWLDPILGKASNGAIGSHRASLNLGLAGRRVLTRRLSM
ncbi:MAG TPA: AAA family ATPase [Candidatus Limnocylindrales bacterium]|nr:AAA family ATPase [Candidatus Limnocylindrales bacterium]